MAAGPNRVIGDFGIRGYSLVDNLPTETWTTVELAVLFRFAPLGARAIAEQTGRTIPAVQRQAYRLHVSLRIRPGALIDPTTAADVAWYVLNDRAPLCPRCSRNPVDSTGFCRPCRLRRLEDAERFAREVKDAERENARVRQANRERLTCPHCGYRMSTRDPKPTIRP